MATVYNVPNPIGIDQEISQAQQALDYIGWLDVIYGRTHIQSREVQENGKTVVRVYPETWGQNYERENLMPNDNHRAFCYFLTRDSADNPNGEEPPYNQFNVRQPVSIIFWGNLQLIDSTRKYRFTEELKRDVFHYLKFAPGFEFERIYEQPDRVLREFSIPLDTYRKYMYPPYFAFRIEGYMNYGILQYNGQCGFDEQFPALNLTPIMISQIKDEIYTRKFEVTNFTGTELQDDRLKGVRVLGFFVGNTKIEPITADPEGGYGFDPVTGTISFNMYGALVSVIYANPE
jgi:hypothetical protein